MSYIEKKHKDYWNYSWINTGVQGTVKHSLRLMHSHEKTVYLFDYDELHKAINSNSIFYASIPKKVLLEAVEEYPDLKKAS